MHIYTKHKVPHDNYIITSACVGLRATQTVTSSPEIKCFLPGTAQVSIVYNFTSSVATLTNTI